MKQHQNNKNHITAAAAQSSAVDAAGQTTVALDGGDTVVASSGSKVDETVVPVRPEPVEQADEAMRHEDDIFCRYHSFILVGKGGSGIVESCIDPALGRRVAVKMLQPQFRDDSRHRRRFVREARIMAQIEHPNVMPVHELGECGEGNYYYTMKYLKGTSLHQVLDRLRQDSPGADSEFPIARLIDIFEHVCQAVAFAHSRGVIHRDLKPENVMIGSFGEVLVVDWGLAKVFNDTDDDEAARAEDQDTLYSQLLENITLDGAIAGTPTYMAPEQAAGQISNLDERTDIYSLGAILYEILTLKRTVTGTTVREVMEQVMKAEIPHPLSFPRQSKIPRELAAICMKALRKNPSERYQSVEAMLSDLYAYQRGFTVSCLPNSLPTKFWKLCMRHRTVAATISLAVLTAALVLGGLNLIEQSRFNTLAQAGYSHFERGNIIYDRLAQTQSSLNQMRESRKNKTTGIRERQLENEVKELEAKAENEYGTAMLLFNQAELDLFNTEFGEYLEAIYLHRLEYAKLTNNVMRARELLTEIRSRTGVGFNSISTKYKDQFAKFADWAAGNVALSIEIEGDYSPTATLFRIVKTPGAPWRLEQVDDIELPLIDYNLETGEYIVEITTNSTRSFNVPLLLEHGANEKIKIKTPGLFPPETVYVSAGEFWKGGEDSPTERLHRERTNAFFIARHEVSFREYMQFWLAENGGAGKAELIPKLRFAADEFTFYDAWNENGKLLPMLEPEQPVVGVSIEAARQYCRWLGDQIGCEVRLPTASEWEKAARGVDARRYVWGDDYLPDAAFTNENTQAKERFELMAPCASFPLDESVYGVCDLAGNVREWTSTRFDNSENFIIKGASFATSRRFLPCASADDAQRVPSDIGFRYVIPEPATK